MTVTIQIRLVYVDTCVTSDERAILIKVLGTYGAYHTAYFHQATAFYVSSVLRPSMKIRWASQLGGKLLFSQLGTRHGGGPWIQFAGVGNSSGVKHIHCTPSFCNDHGDLVGVLRHALDTRPWKIYATCQHFNFNDD
jgi:hypothetical protein